MTRERVVDAGCRWAVVKRRQDATESNETTVLLLLLLLLLLLPLSLRGYSTRGLYDARELWPVLYVVGWFQYQTS